MKANVASSPPGVLPPSPSDALLSSTGQPRQRRGSTKPQREQTAFPAPSRLTQSYRIKGAYHSGFRREHQYQSILANGGNPPKKAARGESETIPASAWGSVPLAGAPQGLLSPRTPKFPAPQHRKPSSNSQTSIAAWCCCVSCFFGSRDYLLHRFRTNQCQGSRLRRMRNTRRACLCPASNHGSVTSSSGIHETRC